MFFLDVIYFNNLELNRSTWCGNIYGIIQLFPYQPRAIGEFTEIKPDLISASSSPTIW